MSHDATPAAQVTVFAERLDAQAARYRALLALGEQQQAALERQDMAAFTGLLGEKAALMAEIATADAAVAPYRTVWEAHREEVAEPLQEHLRTTVEGIRAVLERVLVVEHACEVHLQGAKTAVAQDLQHVGRGRQALKSYRPAAPPPERHRLDLGG